MNTTHRIRFTALVAAGALLVSLSAASAASARPEPQPPRGLRSDYGTVCPLERIGSQFVRCDNLTGAGVPAPEWIREQRLVH